MVQSQLLKSRKPHQQTTSSKELWGTAIALALFVGFWLLCGILESDAVVARKPPEPRPDARYWW